MNDFFNEHPCWYNNFFLLCLCCQFCYKSVLSYVPATIEFTSCTRYEIMIVVEYSKFLSHMIWSFHMIFEDGWLWLLQGGWRGKNDIYHNSPKLNLPSTRKQSFNSLLQRHDAKSNGEERYLFTIDSYPAVITTQVMSTISNWNSHTLTIEKMLYNDILKDCPSFEKWNAYSQMWSKWFKVCF